MPKSTLAIESNTSSQGPRTDENIEIMNYEGKTRLFYGHLAPNVELHFCSKAKSDIRIEFPESNSQLVEDIYLKKDDDKIVPIPAGKERALPYFFEAKYLDEGDRKEGCRIVISKNKDFQSACTSFHYLFEDNRVTGRAFFPRGSGPEKLIATTIPRTKERAIKEYYLVEGEMKTKIHSVKRDTTLELMGPYKSDEFENFLMYRFELSGNSTAAGSVEVDDSLDKLGPFTESGGTDIVEIYVEADDPGEDKYPV